MSKLIEIAIEERKKQLRRQMTAQTNQMIKEIIDTEISQLQKDWQTLQQKK